MKYSPRVFLVKDAFAPVLMPGCKLIQNFPAVITGAIIKENEFSVGIRLILQGLQSLLQVGSMIVIGNNNGNLQGAIRFRVFFRGFWLRIRINFQPMPGADGSCPTEAEPEPGSIDEAL